MAQRECTLFTTHCCAAQAKVYRQYALFEELDTGDFDRTRQIFEACIKLIPHKLFTFAKVWSMYAQFEVRQLRLDKARKILGTSIGMCPKEKLFKEYITLELQLREFDRCRQIYEKYLAVSREVCGDIECGLTLHCDYSTMPPIPARSSGMQNWRRNWAI